MIDLLHQMEVEYKTISERETAYTKEHLFLSSSQKSKIKRILGETAHIIENYRNELRIIAHAHEYVAQFRNKHRERLISLLVMKRYFDFTNDPR